MKKFLLALLMFAAGDVCAQSGQAVYDKAYSTFTVVGVMCTTGTSVQLNSTRRVAGFTIAEYRLYNADSADSVYIGGNVAVTTFTSSAAGLANFGETLATAVSRSWRVGINPDVADQAANPIWCRAADAGGAAAVALSLTTFGYK